MTRTDNERKYLRLRLGPGAKYAQTCFDENFVGADWLEDLDLTGEFPKDYRKFTKKYIPIYLSRNPDKSIFAARHVCGSLHTICRGIEQGGIVLCPDGKGHYRIGEITGDYHYEKGDVLCHRRAVRWLEQSVAHSDFSEALQKTAGVPRTDVDLKEHTQEIDALMTGNSPPVATDPDIEDPGAFAMEKHLEEFLVENWQSCELGKNYQIFEEDGELIGQQYQTDTGRIDILAISKDRKELLVVELKKGRASDSVVGQIQRYMGFISDMAEEGQTVRGCIIALDDDLRIKRALQLTPQIDFYKYEISFNLVKVQKT